VLPVGRRGAAVGRVSRGREGGVRAERERQRKRARPCFRRFSFFSAVRRRALFSPNKSHRRATKRRSTHTRATKACGARAPPQSHKHTHSRNIPSKSAKQLKEQQKKQTNDSCHKSVLLSLSLSPSLCPRLPRRCPPSIFHDHRRHGRSRGSGRAGKVSYSRGLESERKRLITVSPSVVCSRRRRRQKNPPKNPPKPTNENKRQRCPGRGGRRGRRRRGRRRGL